MQILVFGAGVLGSLFAARLRKPAHSTKYTQRPVML